MSTNIPLTGKFEVTCEYKRKGNLWSAGYHTGIDLIGSDNIYSSCKGIVVKLGFDKSYGNYIVVKNEVDGKYHWFCHLSKILKNIGDKVTRVCKIGVMGATGNVTGKHLHFEIRGISNKYGDDENPAVYMGIPNKIGKYNSQNYQLSNEVEKKDNNPTENLKVGDIKKFKVNTNIREDASLSAKAHLYLANTTVKMLEINVANQDGYIWDKVKALYAQEGDFNIGYVARTCNRYK